MEKRSIVQIITPNRKMDLVFKNGSSIWRVPVVALALVKVENSGEDNYSEIIPLTWSDEDKIFTEEWEDPLGRKDFVGIEFDGNKLNLGKKLNVKDYK